MDIRNKESLRNRILELENRKLEQEAGLKTRLEATRESIKPMNLVKDGLSSFTGSAGLGEGLVKTAAGIGIGLLSDKLIAGRTASTVTKALGKMIGLAATNTTIRQTNKIRAYGISIYKNLFGKKKRLPVSEL